MFKTDTVMKPYNRNRWWIDQNIIPEFITMNDSLKEAVKAYVEHVNKRTSVNISNNAIKTKAPAFKDLETGDPLQVGYVITGSSEFDNGNNYVKQYLDLWVTIYELGTVVF